MDNSSIKNDWYIEEYPKDYSADNDQLNNTKRTPTILNSNIARSANILIESCPT
jgi:hypothetical protein